jgi:hypothetical protein
LIPAAPRSLTSCWSWRLPGVRVRPSIPRHFRHRHTSVVRTPNQCLRARALGPDGPLRGAGDDRGGRAAVPRDQPPRPRDRRVGQAGHPAPGLSELAVRPAPDPGVGGRLQRATLFGRRPAAAVAAARAATAQPGSGMGV